MKHFFTLITFWLAALTASAQYNYLGTYNSEGVPDYLIGRDDVPQKLIDDIGASLPEGYPVPDFNPHYISSGYDTDIRLLDSAAVFVTFVGEGAGYRNVLGFYTYDLDDPYISAPPAEEITIIFPNVSAQYSGGGLITGDKVKLGDLPANTGIGWVLIADGWKGASTGVTNGNWVLFSNPDFNPEAQEAERFHNVLLNDHENQLIVLGFEDIRRDYASCDQDFNDALFYVSANPYTAIASENYVAIADSENMVTSGNEGGLESNGALATLMARRNFERGKKGSPKALKSGQQRLYARMSKTESNKHLPESGMTGKEEVNESSPEDLIAMTNAREVFSADYYLGENRVAAAMEINTEGAVYNHTKNICDRFNGSKLKDVRYVTLDDYRLIYSSIERENGMTEYATWFSVKTENEQYQLASLWNIADYPAGNYLNFQVWGASPAQLFFIAKQILSSLKEENTMTQDVTGHKLPGIFVKSGLYKTGSLTLEVSNPSGAGSMILDMESRATELSNPRQSHRTVQLSGARNETIVLATDRLFDVGFSISAAGSEVHDALYLADGSWGVDSKDATIDDFSISTNEVLYEGMMIERNFEITGQNTGVVNVYRNLSRVQCQTDISEYASFRFSVKNDQRLEISLVDNSDADWDNRWTYTLDPNSEYRDVQIPFDAFTKKADQDLKNLKSLVFSLLSEKQNGEEFHFSIKDIHLSKEAVVLDAEEEFLPLSLTVYPNPASERINIKLPEMSGAAIVQLIDLSGKMIFSNTFAPDAQQEVSVLLDAEPGHYLITVRQNGQVYTSRIMIGR